MSADFHMYAWKCSHFSAKLRGFLNHKRIPYAEKACSLYDLQVRVPRGAGVTVMPTLQDRSGRWLVDTPQIMDQLEQQYPDRSCRAQTPRQRILELLLENWLDDGLMAVSLRTRWGYPENWDDLLRDEAARDLMPGFPLFLSRRLAEKAFKGRMQRALAIVGLRSEEQEQQVEDWALKIFDILERHFADHSYMLGEHPTSADFALLGSLAAHVNRDPWPKREWMADRPVLSNWSDRLHAGEGPHADLLSNDEIAETLSELIGLMLAEYPVLMSQTAAAIEDCVASKSLRPGDELPRVTGDVTVVLHGRDFVRCPFTYAVWRMQRIQAVYQAMPSHDQASVDEFFAARGCADLLKREYGPKLERSGLGTRLAE